MSPHRQTTDGGNTFQTLFGVNGTVYFNGIDCTSETHCCAVAESDDAPAAGAYVYCTTDGSTWKQTFAAPYESNKGESLALATVGVSSLGAALLAPSRPAQPLCPAPSPPPL